METTNGASNFLDGEILLFDKPYGWTSFDLVGKVRNFLSRELKVKRIKVGHAGTLDPLATGVMVLCTGKATRQVDQLQAQEKEYIATLKLGATTPSFDRETQEDHLYPSDHITRDLLEESLRKNRRFVWWGAGRTAKAALRERQLLRAADEFRWALATAPTGLLDGAVRRLRSPRRPSG